MCPERFVRFAICLTDTRSPPESLANMESSAVNKLSVMQSHTPVKMHGYLLSWGIFSTETDGQWHPGTDQWRVDNSISVFLFWSAPGWSSSAVWLLLCVHDFGCVGCVCLCLDNSRAQRLKRDREVNQSIARGLESGFVDLSVLMVFVIWTKSLKAHGMQPGPCWGICAVRPVCLCIWRGEVSWTVKRCWGAPEEHKNFKKH